MKMFPSISRPTVVKRITHESETKHVSSSWSGLKFFYADFWLLPHLEQFCL